MKAADLERLLAVRGTLTENVANAVGWGASSIIAAFLLGCAILCLAADFFSILSLQNSASKPRLAAGAGENRFI